MNGIDDLWQRVRRKERQVEAQNRLRQEHMADLETERDEALERLAEVEAERDEAREQVIAAEAEATELALRVEEVEEALRVISEYDPEAVKASGVTPTSVRDIAARALLGEGAEDAD